LQGIRLVSVCVCVYVCMCVWFPTRLVLGRYGGWNDVRGWIAVQLYWISFKSPFQPLSDHTAPRHHMNPVCQAASLTPGAALAFLCGVWLRTMLPAEIKVVIRGYGTPRIGNAAWADYVDNMVRAPFNVVQRSFLHREQSGCPRLRTVLACGNQSIAHTCLIPQGRIGMSRRA
jgi:hypothetical protein